MKNIKRTLFSGFIKLCLVWVLFALVFDVTMITLSVVNPKLATRVGNELTWKLDSRFKK